MIIIIFLSSKVSGVARKKTVLCLLALTREHRVACQALMMKETHFMDRSALFSSHLSLINLLASTLLRFFVYVLLIFTRIQSTSYIQFVWTGCYKPYLCHFKIDFQFPTRLKYVGLKRDDFFANHCRINYLEILGFIVFPTCLSHFNCLIIKSTVMLLHLNRYFFFLECK